MFSSTSVAPGCRVLSVQLVKGVSIVAFGRTHFATPEPVSATKTVLASAEREKPERAAPLTLSSAVHATELPGTGSAGVDAYSVLVFAETSFTATTSVFCATVHTVGRPVAPHAPAPLASTTVCSAPVPPSTS